MATPALRLCLAFICLQLALTHALQQDAVAPVSTVAPPTPTTAPAAGRVPPYTHWRGQARGNFRHSSALGAPAAPAASHSEFKELMTNLHDRVSVLATLDEDQRHRLEVIDKKVDRLLDSNEGRMESLKAQQLNFQQRLDSFEHIQRLARHTLDELKGETDQYLGTRSARALRHKQKNRDRLRDLSRQVRAAPDDGVATENIASIFKQGMVMGAAPRPATESRAATRSRAAAAAAAEPATGRAAEAATFNGTQLDVNSRLDALATLIVSLAYNVRDTQENVGKLVQSTNHIKRRLANRSKGQSARLPQATAVAAAAAESHEEQASSCLQSYLVVNGIIKLQLTPESEPFYVPCEGDGWTVIMNRSTDDVSFERSWLEYKEGFGNLAGDFFIGLDKLHALTNSALHELLIQLEDFDGNVALAGYDSFAISGERELYALSLLGRFQQQLQPSAGDSLSYQAGAKFSTFDNDNDNCVDCSCAQRHRAGGWFNACATSNLMGVHRSQNPERVGETGIFWDTFQGKEYSLRRAKLLIRPVGQDEARR